MRDIIRQLIKFTDYYSANPNKISAEIIIDIQNGLCMFNADDYVSIDTFVTIMYGNKQVRKLTDVSREIYRIESKDSFDYYVKGNVHFDGPIELYDREYLFKFGDEGIMRTGWFSFTELSRIAFADVCDEPLLAKEDANYKQILRMMDKKFDFEYCEVKEI